MRAAKTTVICAYAQARIRCVKSLALVQSCHRRTVAVKSILFMSTALIDFNDADLDFSSATKLHYCDEIMICFRKDIQY